MAGIHVIRERLKAALNASEFDGNATRLARKAGVQPSTLTGFLGFQRRTGSMRRRTIERLARALRVPAEWLTGERNDLPFVLERGLLTPANDTRPTAWEKPNASGLRQSWLYESCSKALRRDLARWMGPKSERALREWGMDLIHVIDELASPTAWRVVFLRPSGSNPFDPRVLIRFDNKATIAWLADCLEPWLEARAYLNVSALAPLLSALIENPDRDGSSYDQRMVVALAEYDRARLRFEKKRRRK